MAELGLWPAAPTPDLDVTKLIAHVVQSHPVTPEQVGRMSLSELALYCVDAGREEMDLGTYLCHAEAKEKLTFAQRIELQRRLMR